MKILLKLKHWQLFGLLISIMLIGSFYGMSNNQVVWSITTFLFAITYYGWFWSIGINLHSKLPPTINLNLSRFKLFMLIPTVYILFLSFWLVGSFIGNSGWITILVLPMHLFSMYCIFWCLVFVAKSIKAVELQKPVTFSEYAGEFFLIWFFPLGIWIIQPRINKLLDKNLH